MSDNDGRELSHDDVQRFARYDLETLGVVTGLIQRDSTAAANAFAQLSEKLLADHESVVQYVLWLLSQYTVVYAAHLERLGIDVGEDIMNRGLFSVTVLQDPSQFQKTVDEDVSKE
jgi:hypothetical protein